MLDNLVNKGKIVNGKLPFINPATGEQFGEVPAATEAEIRSAVGQMRSQAPEWEKTPIKERMRILRRFYALLFNELDHITAVISQDTGKPRQDALIEVFTSLNYFNTMLNKAPRWLADETVNTGLQLFKRAYIKHRPYGVVAVIAPWNYPFILAINPILGALIAGNSVVAKLSEVTPAVGVLMEELFAQVPELSKNIRFIHGDGKSGAALVDAAPDLIFVTGSVRTGQLISQAAAIHLTPVICELGGKDAMIVLDDADLKAAAQWGAWGSFSNSGQTCMAPERVYVSEAVYDTFLTTVKAEAAAYRVGYEPGTESAFNYGSVTFPRQMEIVQTQLQDALEKGATLHSGGRAKDMFFEPTILTGVTDEMLLLKEETFGAIMPIIKVKDETEAVRLANQSEFGLSASVFSENPERAKRVAEALQVGSVNINDTLTHYGIPEVPFGGVKKSGSGRSNGKAGLLAFTRPAGYVSGKPSAYDIGAAVRKPGSYRTIKNAMYTMLAPSLKQRLSGLWELLFGRKKN